MCSRRANPHQSWGELRQSAILSGSLDSLHQHLDQQAIPQEGITLNFQNLDLAYVVTAMGQAAGATAALAAERNTTPLEVPTNIRRNPKSNSGFAKAAAGKESME